MKRNRCLRIYVTGKQRQDTVGFDFGMRLQAEVCQVTGMVLTLQTASWFTVHCS